MRSKVVVARELPSEAMRLLEGRFEVEVNRGEPWSKPELMARVGEAEALICQLTQKVDAEVLAAGPKLRVVANVAVGYDNVDVAAAAARGIAVTNTPGVLDDSTADFTWALLLAVARRVVEGDRLVREGKWKGWDLMLMLGADVHGKTLGIFGIGRIGRKVAERARGFGMRVLYHSRRRLEAEEERELHAEWVEKERLLREADFVTLHLPLTVETRHFIGARELERMKPTAYLINAARGPVVEEAALAEALERKQIAGAALDVFEREPEVHPKLVTLPNVVLAPHVASAAVETRTRMAVMAVENAVAVLENRKPPNLVNQEAWKKRMATGD